jgi:hypothetical protein
LGNFSLELGEYLFLPLRNNLPERNFAINIRQYFSAWNKMRRYFPEVRENFTHR